MFVSAPPSVVDVSVGAGYCRLAQLRTDPRPILPTPRVHQTSGLLTPAPCDSSLRLRAHMVCRPIAPNDAAEATQAEMTGDGARWQMPSLSRDWLGSLRGFITLVRGRWLATKRVPSHSDSHGRPMRRRAQLRSPTSIVFCFAAQEPWI